MKNLILGMVAHFNLSQIYPFVESLKKTEFDGELVFFTAHLAPELEEYLRQSGVNTLPFDIEEGEKLMPVHALRYFLYLSFLKQYWQDYDAVMIADTRDVFFQKDPFDFPHEPEFLHCFLENEPIGQCAYNSHWIRARYGEAVLEEMKNHRISCSGVSVGSSREMLTYLETMKEGLMPPEKTVGYDQGVHNRLLFTGKIPYASMKENFEGAVLTLGRVSDSELTYDVMGNVLNRDGSIIPVLHQYERLPSLLERVKQRLGANK